MHFLLESGAGWSKASLTLDLVQSQQLLLETKIGVNALQTLTHTLQHTSFLNEFWACTLGIFAFFAFFGTQNISMFLELWIWVHLFFGRAIFSCLLQFCIHTTLFSSIWVWACSRTHPWTWPCRGFGGFAFQKVCHWSRIVWAGIWLCRCRCGCAHRYIWDQVIGACTDA